MSPSFVDRALPSASLMLTIKVDGLPGVHLVYDHTRPFEESTVTVLDQTTSAPWNFEEVIFQALDFLLAYWGKQHKWPAELRSPCAGRPRAAEPS